MATIKVLVVGAGGGGGGKYGAGGGGGQLQYDAALSIIAQAYSVTVGAGGTGGSGTGVSGSQGASSIFSSITSQGGFGGATQGGGGSATGGASGGGTGAGGNSSSSPTAGGNGTANSISGASVTYGGGGGGSKDNGNPGGAGGTGGGGTGGSQNNLPVAGTANTGGGGGGNAGAGSDNVGANGGSGIVILSYPVDTIVATGGTITTSGGETIHTFTSSDTFTVSSVVPSLTTEAVTSITLNTATGNGTVVAQGASVVTDRGFVWNTAGTPTLVDSSVSVSGTTGAFTGSITSLTNGVTYYVRAYATSSEGTGYGNQVSFTTLSAEADTIYKDIDGVEGETYAVSINVGGSTGYVTVSLGSTGYSTNINAGSGVTVIQGAYGGINGLTIVKSATFDGYIDSVMWVLVLGDATIDWSLDTLTNVYPINSSVTFKRLEDKDFDKFRIYRYLDIQFKDLTAYVTVLLKKEANEDLVDGTKQFLVSNTSGESLPFINKRLSTLTKNYGMRVKLSNNRIDETFTVCQLVITGMDNPRKTFSSSKIISVS